MEKDKTDLKKTIFIIDFDGRTFPIQVELSESVKGLKDRLALEKKIDLQPDELNLDFGAIILADSRTLRDYNIKDNSAIYCTRRFLGGGGCLALDFVDLSKGKFKELTFSETAPDWRRVGRGLNIHGECQQEKCVAFKNEVICPIKENPIDLVTERSKIKCPECKSMIEMDSCGFLYCIYSIEGKRYDDATGGIIDFKVDNQYTGNLKYKYFGSDINGKTIWIKLKITVLIR